MKDFYQHLNKIDSIHFKKGRIFKVKGLTEEIRICKVDFDLEWVSFNLKGQEVWVEFGYLMGSEITPSTFKYFRNIKYEDDKVILLARKQKPFLSFKLKEDGFYYYNTFKDGIESVIHPYIVKVPYAHIMQHLYCEPKNYELI